MKESNNKKKLGYAKLLTPKGNDADGFAISNEFEKVLFKYSSQGLNSQVEEMMNDWISDKVRSEEEAIFKDIKIHSRIKTA
jgi:ATP-dependent protease HslVU (ClpYQ) peptidase subunit